MDLSRNELSGALPSEIADLSSLLLLWIYSNDLSGPIPMDFVKLTLRSFDWKQTKLCAPADQRQAFQGWLSGLEFNDGGVTCAP